MAIEGISPEHGPVGESPQHRMYPIPTPQPGEKYEIEITRTVKSRGKAIWPDCYEDMTLEEAVKYEERMSDGDHLEQVMNDPNVELEHIQVLVTRKIS